MLSGMEVGLELLPQAWGRASRGAVMDLARLQEVVLLTTSVSFWDVSGCSQDLCLLTLFPLPWDPGALPATCE